MWKQTRNIELFPLLFVSLFAISNASPIRKLYDNYPSPKWWNACRWPTFDRIFMGSVLLPMDELLHNVMNGAKVTKNHAQHIKQLFVENTFSDPIFDNSVKEYTELEWLPVIPDTTEQVFQKLTIEDAVTTAYELMQFFAVGIEQILIDQQLYSGSMIKQFKEIKYELYQLLCELQNAIHLLNIQQKPNVSRSVMSRQYRDIEELSRRNLRDFTILTSYINATHFIANLFAYLKTNLNGWHSTD